MTDWEFKTPPMLEGYYQAFYYNEEQKEWFYKALFYNTKLNKWIGPWHWSYDQTGPHFLSDEKPEVYYIVHKGLNVEKYDPASRTDYYGQQFSGKS